MPNAPRVATAGLCSAAPIRRIDTRFLSVTLDYALLLGAPWWEGTRRTARSFGNLPAPLVDLADFRLRRYAQALAPAYLRLGGSEADRIRYEMNGAAPAGVRTADYRSVLTAERWDELCRFAAESDLDLFVTVNAGPGPRLNDGSWDPENARELVSHAAGCRQPVAVWELGNEVNGFPFIHGLSRRISPRQYAADFARFDELIRHYAPEARTAGPGSAVWPLLGEVFPTIPGFLKQAPRKPDIITWHYYPQQSSRGVVATRRADPYRVLKPRRLDAVSGWARRIARHVRRSAGPAGAEIWLGETGHALYGGEPGVSDRFIAGLWWMDQLGLLARTGVGLIARQSLVGGDYGLLDSSSLKPRPDYWSSLLWKGLMGEDVYAAVADGGRRLRVYAHRSRRGDGVTLLVINVDRSRSVRVHVDADSLGFTPRRLDLYLVTAPDPLSAELHINGMAPALPDHPGAPPAPPRQLSAADGVPVPPLSYAFVTAVT